MTVMLPLQAGCAVDAGCPLLPADIAAALARLPVPRWLVATPLHLQACLAAGQRMPPFSGVLCATATLSLELALAVEQAWGGALWEIYGSTETGGLAFECPANPSAYHVHENFVIPEILDEADQPVGPGEEGELVITTLFRRSMPLIRFRTRNVVRRAPAGRCRCGHGSVARPDADGRQSYADDLAKAGGRGSRRPIHVRPEQTIVTSATECPHQRNVLNHAASAPGAVADATSSWRAGTPSGFCPG
jgi:acyl-coenzyme A synthetase/AMP-(fatty) acid ligase